MTATATALQTARAVAATAAATAATIQPPKARPPEGSGQRAQEEEAERLLLV